MAASTKEATLSEAAKDALDYLTLLYNQGDIDGQIGGEVMSQLASALENGPTVLADANTKVAPIDAVSGLVEELRKWAQFESARSAGVLTRAADALEAQARALAELRGKLWAAAIQVGDEKAERLAAQARIAALEAAARVKDETPAEPVAWVVPGDDIAKANGFIDAMAWREGEFTRPLYGAPQHKEDNNG